MKALSISKAGNEKTGKVYSKRLCRMSQLAPLRPEALLQDVSALITEARRQAAAVVNMGLTMLYWRIGRRVGGEVLGGERAAYGEQIVATLSRQLTSEYSRDYTEKSAPDCPIR